MAERNNGSGAKIWVLNILTFISIGSIIGASITYGVMQNRIDTLDKQVTINTPRITQLEIDVAQFKAFLQQYLRDTEKNNKDHERILNILDRLYNKQISAIKGEPNYGS